LPKKAADGNLTTNNRLKTFFINKNIRLYGGFSGTETALNQRNWSANPTILSGDVGNPGVHTDNSYHVVWFNGVSTAAVLNGFIIEHGFANGNETNNDDVGGGMYINGDNFVESSPTIVNCTFRNNHCIFSTGAAVYVCARWDGFARPVFLQCQFIQSGLFDKSLVRHYVRARGICEPTYRQCSFSRNTAPSGEYEITNHVEFAANSSTKVHTRMYNTIIWNNRYATTATGSFTGATRQVDLFNCLSDTLGNNAFPSNSLIHQDPQFTGLATLDLSLQAGSPAVNAGSNAFLDTLTKDLAVQNRIRSGIADIGAFEHPSDCLNGPIVTISSGFANCSGNATAMLSGGGTEPYEYLWSNGQTTATASNLAAGTYMVTATDANGCLASATVVITEPGALQAEITATTPITCFGANNGMATTILNGGTTPYQYLWSNGQTTPTANGLAAGTYTVTATDANGCLAAATVVIHEPDALQAAISNSTPSSCFGENNGTAMVNVNGGTAPYQYLWSNEQTTQTASNLAAGTHTLTATDAHGCQALATVVITEPGVLQAAIANSTPSSCFGENTGTAMVSVNGGTSPYEYLWSNGQTTATASGLAANTYTVTATDANGCQASATVVITGPGALQAIATAAPITCFGAANGTAMTNVNGGTAPYQYLWSNGQTTATTSGLTAGTYTVTATDANGCQALATVVITEPGALQAEIAAATPISCFGEDNGMAEVNVNGGTAPYQYLWNNGQTTPTVSGLAAGTYTVTATDVNGCQASATVSIATPEALSGQITAIQQPVCPTIQNGALSATASGGTAPYTYTWSTGQTTPAATGLDAGLYEVVITDSAGCTFSESITLTAQYEIFSAFSVMQNLACHGDSTAAVTASAMGGVAPFSYQWAHGPQSPSLSGLPAGTYSVTIMDANGCTATGSAVFINPPVLALTVTAQATTCEEAADGAITATAAGGTAPYTFLWSNGQTSGEINGLTMGTYAVSVTDDLGCTVTTSGTITALPFDPDPGIEQANHTLTALENETDYQWINCATGQPIPGATNQSFTASENGNYAVILIQGECQDTSECVEVIIVSTGQVEATLLRAEAFPNPNNGKFTLSLPWPAEVTLHDAAGRILQTGFYAAGVHTMYTDTPTNLYFLLLRHSEGVQTIRIIQN